MSRNHDPEIILTAFHQTFDALEAYEKNKHRCPILKTLCKQIYPNKKNDTERARDFRSQQQNAYDALFTDLIDLSKILDDLSYVLETIRHFAHIPYEDRRNFTRASRECNTLLEAYMNRIDDIYKAEQSALLSFSKSTSASSIHQDYNRIYLNYDYTEAEPSPDNERHNIALLKRIRDKIYDKTLVLIDCDTAIAQGRIAYFYASRSLQNGEFGLPDREMRVRLVQENLGCAQFTLNRNTHIIDTLDNLIKKQYAGLVAKKNLNSFSSKPTP